MSTWIIFRTGESDMFREFTPAILEMQPDPALLREAGLGCYISVPVKARRDGA